MNTLDKLLHEFSDVVKMKLGSGEPVDIEPLKIRLKTNAIPVRAKPRKYPLEKRVFISRYVGELKRMGFVKPAISPEWISMPLVVPKKPPAMFRMAIDYRAINAATQSTSWPMPNIDAELVDTRKAKRFALIDFCSSFWQAPLDPDSQAFYAFMAANGVVMPTRTPQGGCNSAANFQEKVEPCFIELRDHYKAWLDDFLIFAESEDQLLQILRRFFEICRTRRLIISLPKSEFFLTKAQWCGRIIDEHGVRFNPKNISGIMNSNAPLTAGELCEYVHAVSWMSSSIPRFSERVA
ncbi:MAG: reverse transcriptase family protein, partial [Cyanobacteria bacterium P01_H01_bin.15]